MAVVSPNPHRQDNVTMLRELEKGDLIQFPRTIFSHWAVYIGGEDVVHLAPGDDNAGISDSVHLNKLFTICGKSFNKALVKRDNFWNVVEDSKAVKNNDKDRKLTPLARDDIVERALSKLGDIGYNVLWKNCEHFTSWCRYDKEWSEQADTIEAMAVTGVVAVGIAAGIAISKGNDKGNDKENDKEQTS